MAIKIVQGTPAHRTYLLGATAVAAIVLVALPFVELPSQFGNPTGQLQNWSRVLAFAVAILGLNLVIGYSGQISIGHSAFIGLGAYATIISIKDYGWNFWVALPLAFVVPFVAGCVVGLPALRIKGLYLVVVTFAVAITFPTLVIRFERLTGGSNGKGLDDKLEPPSWTPFDARDRLDPFRYRYFVLLGVAFLMFFFARNMLTGRSGRSLIAQRDNPTAAAISGVPVSVNKVLVFGLSAGYCGVGGWMLMLSNPFASDVSFSVALSITLIIGLVVGGGATLTGAIPGAMIAVVLQYLLEQLTEQTKLGPVPMHWLQVRPGKGGIVSVVFGLLLLATVFLLPGGIVDGINRLRKHVINVIPNPKWLASTSKSKLAPSAMAQSTVELSKSH